MKQIGMNLSSMNGFIFFKVEKYFLGFEYVTPCFNDYGEWRVEELRVYDTLKDSDFNELEDLFEIDMNSIDQEKILDELEEWIQVDPENLWWSLPVKLVNYRAPTEKEMEESGRDISDYKIGTFFIEENGDLTKEEEYLPEFEIYKLAAIVAKSVYENQEIVLESKPDILF